jgi:hypothetical protein
MVKLNIKFLKIICNTWAGEVTPMVELLPSKCKTEFKPQYHQKQQKR